MTYAASVAVFRCYQIFKSLIGITLLLKTVFSRFSASSLIANRLTVSASDAKMPMRQKCVMQIILIVWIQIKGKDEAFIKTDKEFLLTLVESYFSSPKTNEVGANQVEHICFFLFDGISDEFLI